MKDITIVNLCFGAKDSDGKVGYIPLGPLYVTSALEAKGYEVDFRDYLVGAYEFPDPMDPGNLLAFFEGSCEVIGVGCTGGTLPFALSALSKLKDRHPEKVIILGGIGPTGAAGEIMQNFPFVDIIVKGEGEAAIVEIMESLESGKGLEDIRGILYRKDGRVHMNPARRLIENLDDVPFPSYGQVNPGSYSIAGLATSRGCPYLCTFCDTAPFWGRDCRVRSVDNVIREIGFLHDKYGITDFEFVDDTFVLDRERVYEFCEKISREKPGIRWTCCGRIDLMDEKLMHVMAENGCKMVFYGMESGSDKILKRIKKRFSREQARQVIARSAAYFDIYVSFIWGFPFESMEDFRDTIDCTAYVSELGGTPWLFSLAPLPLSSLYQEYKDTLLFSEDWCVNMAGAGKEKLFGLLKMFPGVFSGFYRYETDGFAEKYDIIKERGLMGHGSQTVFLDGLLASKWA